MAENQLSPELIQQMIEMSGDPETKAMLAQQLSMADHLRGTATASNTGKNAFGAIAQGLAGYKSGQLQKEYGTGLGKMGQRQQAGKRAWYDAMYPQKPAPQQPGMDPGMSVPPPVYDEGGYGGYGG